VAIKRDQADAWFSKCIRHRAQWKCECCGKQYTKSDTGLHAAHIFGRAGKSTRWDLGNAIALDYACHQRFTANPVDFHTWLYEYLGSGHMELLKERRRLILKTNKELRAEIAKHYREEYQRAEQDPNYIIIGW
jgi:hypothetical protein